MARTDDDVGADSLPVGLVATTIVVAILVALVALGIADALPAVELASVDRQAGTAADDCRFLLSLAPRHLDDPGAPPGAMRIMHFDLPEGTEYLSFGFDPDTGGGHEGMIYYKVRGSKKALVVDERASFRSPDGSQTLLRSGSYDLQVEYVCDALGRRYLLVSGAQ
ncbi:MAG TPA: hypothetical protein VLT35_05555 [Methanocella sp.]|nr:hypothetical protein [Methanocella sp.]